MGVKSNSARKASRCANCGQPAMVYDLDGGATCFICGTWTESKVPRAERAKAVRRATKFTVYGSKSRQPSAKKEIESEAADLVAWWMPEAVRKTFSNGWMVGPPIKVPIRITYYRTRFRLRSERAYTLGVSIDIPKGARWPPRKRFWDGVVRLFNKSHGCVCSPGWVTPSQCPGLHLVSLHAWVQEELGEWETI